MGNIVKFRMLVPFILLFLFQSCSQTGKLPENEKSDQNFYSMDDFDKVEKYDTHVHISVDDSTFIKPSKLYSVIRFTSQTQKSQIYFERYLCHCDFAFVFDVLKMIRPVG